MHIRTNHQVCLRGRSHLTAAATALLLAGASLLTASGQASSATGPSPSTTPSPPPSLSHLTRAAGPGAGELVRCQEAIHYTTIHAQLRHHLPISQEVSD